jgi:hypothetical protein
MEDLITGCAMRIGNLRGHISFLIGHSQYMSKEEILEHLAKAYQEDNIENDKS